MSVKLLPEIVFDAPPSEFDDEIHAACEAVHEACKGWGTDESGLIEALGSQPADKRFLIYHCYTEKYGKDLKKVMRSECGSGDFGMALQLLALPLHEAEAKMVKEACRGFGTKESLIYPIVCGRTNEEIQKLKETFFSLYEEDMGVLLNSELGGDFERMIFYALQGSTMEYDPDYHSDEKVEEDVEKFYEAGQGAWGTDESSLFKIISDAPPEHLEKVNELYVEKHERTLIAILDTELGGDVEKAARYAVGMKIKPYETAAALIKKCCAGFGTDEMGLTCALIRFQAILPDVEAAHQVLYEKSIIDRINDEVSGDYKALLLKIVETAL